MHEQLQIDMINLQTNSDVLCDQFYISLNTAITNCFPIKPQRSRTSFPQNHWFTDECKALKREVNTYAKLYDISKSPFAEKYRELELKYKQVVQRCKRLYNDSIRSKLKKFHSNNPTEYWKLWKSFRPREINNSKLTLDDFNAYFINQTSPPNTEYFNQEFMSNCINFIRKYQNDEIEIDINHDTGKLEISDEICNSPISMEEIQTHLNKLKNNKAPGIDGIPGEFLKNASDDLCPTLYLLYNSIFDSCDWPSKWAEGLINPVHKKGSINVTDNYRKITVMPALGKFWSHS